MVKELSTEDVARAKQLLEPLEKPYRLGFPTMSMEDAMLCVRYLLNTSPASARMLVASNRGQVIDDIDPPVDATFEK